MLYAVEKNLESWHSNKQRYFTMPGFLLLNSRTWYLLAMEQTCGKLAHLDDVVSGLVVMASTSTLICCRCTTQSLRGQISNLMSSLRSAIAFLAHIRTRTPIKLLDNFCKVYSFEQAKYPHCSRFCSGTQGHARSCTQSERQMASFLM